MSTFKPLIFASIIILSSYRAQTIIEYQSFITLSRLTAEYFDTNCTTDRAYGQLQLYNPLNYRENFGCIGDEQCTIDELLVETCTVTDDYPIVNPFPFVFVENSTEVQIELFRCGKLLYPYGNGTNNGCWDCGDFKYLQKSSDDSLGICLDCISNCIKCLEGSICMPSGCAYDKFYHVRT